MYIVANYNAHIIIHYWTIEVEQNIVICQWRADQLFGRGRLIDRTKGAEFI